MRMSLPHAILGFLNYQPLSGYDLKKAFDVSIQHFWPADQSQIYRSLALLAERGWATLEVVPQEDRPDRKVYHITDEGRAELRRWLTAPLTPELPRSAPLIQVFFAGQLPDEEILPLFERGIVQLRGLLERYARVPAESQVYQDTLGSPREVFFWMLTLEFGVSMARAQLELMERVVQRIQSKAHPSA
jgi:PadR family transcriptional regulator, regulatory protein AphA